MLRGAQMPQLLGVREARLEVLAEHHAMLEPIPFQIDERRPDGRYALPEGIRPVAAEHPGILERDDEMALMLDDMGRRALRNARFRPGTIEIEARDPLDGTSRYAYVDARDRPRRSSVRYIAYDPIRDRIETDFYRIGLTRGWPTEFALQHQIHGDAPNLIDRFKVRTSAKIFELFTYHMNEDAIHSRLLAWKVGPVRMLRLESHSVKLLLGLHSPAVQSQVFLYRNYVESPTRVNFPWVPRLVLDHVRVRLDVDYLDLDGFLLTWSGMNGPPMLIGGNSAEERELESGVDPPPAQWLALRGDGRLLIQTLRPSPDVALIQRTLYYRNSSLPDPPERYPGEHPGIGYITTGYRNLRRGPHTFDSLFVIAPGTYTAGGLMRELATPLQIKVRPVGTAQ